MSGQGYKSERAAGGLRSSWRASRLRFLLRRFMVAGGVLGLLLAAGVTLLAIFFAAGSPRLSRQILVQINKAVGTDSTRFAGDRVHGTLLRGAVIENPKLIVTTIDGEVIWARAQSLRVEYDLVDLILGRSRDLVVVLSEPRIDIVHDRSGEVVVPRFASKKGGQIPPLQTRMAISIRDGGFSVDREEIRFGGIQGNATLFFGGGRSEVRIRELTGANERPGRQGKFHVSGTVIHNGDSLRAAPLEVALGTSSLTVRADWDLAAGRVRSGTLSLHPLRVRELFRALEVKGSEGTLRGEVDFSGTPSAGEARARLAGDYAGETIDTLVLDARSRPGAVELSGFRLRVREAEITGDGVWHTRGSLVGDVAFHDVNPALLPWWRSPEKTPQGNLAGRARIEARQARPRADITVGLTLAPSLLGRLSIEGGYVHLRLSPDGGAAIDTCSLRIPGGRIAATATLGSDRTLKAGVRGDLTDLGKFNPLLHPIVAAAGSGRLFARVTGTLEDPRFQGQADLFGARLENGLACDTLTVEAQGKLLPKLDLTGDVGARGLGAGGRGLGNLDLTVVGGERLSIERYRQSLGDTLLTLRGVMTFAPEGVKATLDSLALRAGNHQIWSRGPFEISSLKDRVRIEKLVVDLDPGTLEADIDWSPNHETIDARGTLEGLDLSRIPSREGDTSRLEGLVSGEFQAAGRFSDPDLSVRLSVDRPGVGGVLGDQLTLDLVYAPGVLRLERAEWAAGRSRARITGSIRPRFTLEEWMRALGNGDRGWAARASLAMEAEVDSFDLKLLAPADTTLRTLKGDASLRMKITGTPAAPVFDLQGHAPTIGFRGVEGEIVGLGLSYENRRLRVQRFDFRQGGSISKIRGEVPIDLGLYAHEPIPDDAPLALSIDVPGGNLSVLPLLIPDIAAASGRIIAVAEIGGSPRRPKVSGSVKIADGKLRLAGRDEILESITVEAAFDQQRLQVTKATARQGKKGSLSATGWWRWPTAPPAPGEPPAVGPRGDYEFKIKATEFTTTDRENYLFRLTGDFTIVNARSVAGAVVPAITGNVVVNKGELTIDLSKPAEEPGEPLPILYHLNVDIPGNVYYRTLDAEVELESDAPLIFKNEGRGDLALGVLNVRGGKYYILTRQFRNLQGTVNFNSPDRIDPTVNITAETSIPAPEGTRPVYLLLTDRISRLKITVYDNMSPPTPPNDLWKALAMGQFAPTSGFDASGGTVGTQETAGVALPISNYLFQNLEHWIGGSGFIDTIDLRSGAGTSGSTESGATPVSMVGVGKYVTPEFYLKYSRDFSGVGEEQINADYRITRRLLVKGQQITRSSTQDGPSQEYNLDLKIRLEY